MGAGVCPSVVCPSVCRVPRPNSRTERPREPKIGRMEVNHTRSQWTYLEVKRSKVKVTWPINVYTVNAQYLPNMKAYERQTWYTDGGAHNPYHRQAWSKAKGQGRMFTWCVWPIRREQKVLETPGQLMLRPEVRHTSVSERKGLRTWNLVHRWNTKTRKNSHQFQGQRSRSPDRLMLRPEVGHIFSMERPTNF